MSGLLVVNEVFGPVFQGEGKNIGMPCFFLRLSGCNLSCVWCDTPYTWDWTGKNGKVYLPSEESHKMSAEEVLHILAEKQGGFFGVPSFNLVISGGEPMLQQTSMIPLVSALQARDWWVEIETAGTLPPLPDFTPDQFTVSLKLDNSGNSLKKRYNQRAVDAFVESRKAVFKFVVSNVSDFDEIDELVAKHMIPKEIIYVMPEGITEDAVKSHAQTVAQNVIRRGWKLTTRLQILLYGNQRGT